MQTASLSTKKPIKNLEKVEEHWAKCVDSLQRELKHTSIEREKLRVRQVMDEQVFKDELQTFKKAAVVSNHHAVSK